MTDTFPSHFCYPCDICQVCRICGACEHADCGTWGPPTITRQLTTDPIFPVTNVVTEFFERPLQPTPPPPPGTTVLLNEHHPTETGIMDGSHSDLA